MSRPRPKITDLQKRSIRLMHYHRSSIREIAKALDIPYHHIYAEVAVIKAMFNPSQLTPNELHDRLLKADNHLASSVDEILFNECVVNEVPVDTEN